MAEKNGISPRREPRQQRARARIDAILNATAELMEEHDFSRLTTNLVARRAGVNIASIYQYFSNKNAIITALAERILAEYREALSDFPEKIASTEDWRPVINCGLTRLLEVALRQKGLESLRRAMSADPRLAAVAEGHDRAVAGIFAEGLRRRKTSLSETQAMAIAETLVRSSRFLYLSNGPLFGEKDLTLVGEVFKMQYAYLANYLDR
ncbi:MAG: TetR/AcrR family transcriptional regulator [Parvibaculaceae bacterium]|nr:TetR/AcrR family transcriptional regulator [Parvibaculaceae bacterium]